MMSATADGFFGFNIFYFERKKWKNKSNLYCSERCLLWREFFRKLLRRRTSSCKLDGFLRPGKPTVGDGKPTMYSFCFGLKTLSRCFPLLIEVHATGKDVDTVQGGSG